MSNLKTTYIKFENNKKSNLKFQAMNKSILILFTLLVFVQLKCAFGVKPRFAPKYCLRFKFDCTSPEKKGHVCCLFPLPIEGNDLGEKSSSPYKGMINIKDILDFQFINI